MNNKLICPFCQQELKISGHELHDLDLYCDKCEPFMVGNKELWQELIRTRKASDVAVDALKYIRRTNPISFHFEAIEKALEQITALEQKEHKTEKARKSAKKSA